MLTPLGKYLKQLRLDHGNMLLSAMAEQLRKPSSYLSAIEYGRKNCPPDLLNQIFLLFNLDFESRDKLKKAAEESKDSYRIKTTENQNFMARTVAASFARQFSSLNDEQLKELKRILDGGSSQ